MRLPRNYLSFETVTTDDENIKVKDLINIPHCIEPRWNPKKDIKTVTNYRVIEIDNKCYFYIPYIGLLGDKKERGIEVNENQTIKEAFETYKIGKYLQGESY